MCTTLKGKWMRLHFWKIYFLVLQDNCKRELDLRVFCTKRTMHHIIRFSRTSKYLHSIYYTRKKIQNTIYWKKKTIYEIVLTIMIHRNKRKKKNRNSTDVSIVFFQERSLNRIFRLKGNKERKITRFFPDKNTLRSNGKHHLKTT